MKRYNINLWITLVCISVKYLPSADSFQCFECENCPTINGEDAKDYIKECTPLESFSTQGTEFSTMNSSTVAQNSTPSSTSIGLGSNSTNASSSLSLSTSTLPSLTLLNQNETTTKFGSSEIPTTKSSVQESTTEKQKTTSIWSMFPRSIEENELRNLVQEVEEQTEELFSWRSKKASEVCYVLKLNYEGNEIIKRGCGLRGQNEDQTCEILGKGEPNSQCEVCEGNLCNSASTLQTGVIGLQLLIFFVLKAYIL